MIKIENLFAGMTVEKLPVGGGSVGNANIGRLGITGFGTPDFSL